MKTKIGASNYQRLGNTLQAAEPEGSDAGQQARETLHKMAAAVVGPSGQIKRGYLKVTQGEDGLSVGTRWSTRADGSTKDAVDFVRSLVDKGFGDLPGVNRGAVQDALTAYLANKGNRLGTHSFVKLVRQLESAAGMSAAPEDRVQRARVKENAHLNSDAFRSVHGDERLLQIVPTQEQQVVQAPPLAEPPGQPPAQIAPRQEQQVGQAPPLAELPSQPPAQIAPRQDQKVVQAPPAVAVRTEADLKAEARIHTQLALTELRRGNYRAAASSLRAVKPPLSASELARIVVEDHPQRRPATTRLVLFAQEAFRGRRASAKEKAEFAFTAVTLPLGDDLKQPGLDPQRLSGLKDFAKLMLALQPDESKAVAQALAQRVTEELPTLQGSEEFCAELRSIGPEQTIELRFDPNGIKNAAKEIPKTNEGRSQYLDQLQTDHPGTSFAERAANLQTKLRTYIQLLADLPDSDDESDDESANSSARSQVEKRNPEKMIKKLAVDIFEQGQMDQFVNKITSQAMEQKAVQIHIPDSDNRSKFSKVAAETADRYGARIEGSSFDKTAVRKAALSSFTSITNGGMEGVQLVGCVFNGLLTSAYFRGADLSGSDFTVTVGDFNDGLMKGVDFSGAKLDDASIRIDYGTLRNRFETKIFPPGGRQRELVQIMNHSDRTGGGPLTTIASIDDRYAELKVGLMRDALRFIVQEDCLDALARPLMDVLSRSSLFLADAEISRLAAPLVPA